MSDELFNTVKAITAAAADSWEDRLGAAQIWAAVQKPESHAGTLLEKMRALKRELADAQDRVKELEEEEATHTCAYRAMTNARDELFRENAILRKQLGCKSCPPGEECYCKPIGGYEK